jgi:hypothetical protein
MKTLLVILFILVIISIALNVIFILEKKNKNKTVADLKTITNNLSELINSSFTALGIKIDKISSDSAAISSAVSDAKSSLQTEATTDTTDAASQAEALHFTKITKS